MDLDGSHEHISYAGSCVSCLILQVPSGEDTDHQVPTGDNTEIRAHTGEGTEQGSFSNIFIADLQGPSKLPKGTFENFCN